MELEGERLTFNVGEEGRSEKFQTTWQIRNPSEIKIPLTNSIIIREKIFNPINPWKKR